MDLVDEKHIAFFKTGEQSGEFARLLDDRAAGVFYIHAHRIGDDVRQRRFPQAGRTAEQNVLKNVATFLSGFDQQLQTLANFHLAGELAEHRRTQRDFESGIGFGRFHFRWRRFHNIRGKTAHDRILKDENLDARKERIGWCIIDGMR